MLRKIHSRIGLEERDMFHEQSGALAEKLFPIQRQLDEYIVEKKKLHHIDLFDSKMIALKTELYEAINEWRGFKHWSDNRKPTENLLEELSDTLHFILSVGIEQEVDQLYAECPKPLIRYASDDFTTMELIDETDRLINKFKEEKHVYAWHLMFEQFLQMAKRFGYEVHDLYEAYLNKNQINFDRQDNGY